MKKRILLAIVLVLCLIGLARICIPQNNNDQADQARQTQVHKKKHKKIKKSPAELARPYKDPKDLVPEGTWNKKSESKKYPDISNKKDIVIRVSLKGNRVYIIKKGRVVYTMLSTAGIFKHGKSLTPTGTFKIRQGRGDNFFNQGLNEGANNWVSWDPDDSNVYLFHSVPTKADNRYNLKEAQKLGRTQGSHGCVRLSVPDSRWFMKHVKPGTKVIIENE